MGTEPLSPDVSASSSTDTSSKLPKTTSNGGREWPAQTVSVLLIDDDQDDYILTRELLAEIPGDRFTLDWVASYDAGLAAICSGSHRVYLLDYRLGPRTGIELLREAHSHGCSRPVILLTGQGQNRTDLDALDAGADDYLEKAGLTSHLLERAIRYAIAQRSTAIELERKVKERTEALAKANDALREANRRKDEFLSTLGHELRNPLAPILNALEIMRLSGNNIDTVDRQRERLERQVGQMVRLVDDLLDVSRITTGKLRLTPELLTLQDVFSAALDISRTQLEKARLKFTADLPTELVRLNADRVRLAQVFSNLLNNAAKYTEPGGRVSLSARAADGRVVVRVRDTGVGIPRDVLPRVFELFTQVDRTLNRSEGGLGVGLALVRRLVEMHGGTVSAQSDGPGKGTEFTVSLPLAAG
ncbi:MAG TPA: hybrid sensor histidine kinase/response regulator [Gemmata sp.]|nr:hybrid sensor histidine kinase/response regulator [Gemmata sp.]